MTSTPFLNTVKNTYSHITAYINSNQCKKMPPIVLCVTSIAFFIFAFAYTASYCYSAASALTNLTSALTSTSFDTTCTASQISIGLFALPAIYCAVIVVSMLAIYAWCRINKYTSAISLTILSWLMLTIIFNLSITATSQCCCPTILPTALVMCVAGITLAAIASVLAIESTHTRDNELETPYNINENHIKDYCI